MESKISEANSHIIILVCEKFTLTAILSVVFKIQNNDKSTYFDGYKTFQYWYSFNKKEYF